MTRTHWLLLVLAILLPVLVVAGWFLLRPPPDSITAADLSREVAANQPAAQEKYLYRRVRLQGVVRLNLPVENMGEPFTMIELDAPGNLEIQAAFSGPAPVPLEPGDQAIIEGYCSLFQGNVVYFEDCRLISRDKGEAK